jgi:predicted nuclease of predicted toxin-antitoxin system
MTSGPWVVYEFCEDTLSELYLGSAHVAEFDSLERPDREIWDFAQTGGFVIVTADADFYELAAALGPPPKVIWLRRWTHPTRDAEFVLRRDAIRMPSHKPAYRSQS